jgi:hypothetical protein
MFSGLVKSAKEVAGQLLAGLLLIWIAWKYGKGKAK